MKDTDKAIVKTCFWLFLSASTSHTQIYANERGNWSSRGRPPDKQLEHQGRFQLETTPFHTEPPGCIEQC